MRLERTNTTRQSTNRFPPFTTTPAAYQTPQSNDEQRELMADQKANVVVQTAVPEVRVTITRPPFNPVPAVRKHLPNAGKQRAHTSPERD